MAERLAETVSLDKIRAVRDVVEQSEQYGEAAVIQQAALLGNELGQQHSIESTERRSRRLLAACEDVVVLRAIKSLLSAIIGDEDEIAAIIRLPSGSLVDIREALGQDTRMTFGYFIDRPTDDQGGI